MKTLIQRTVLGAGIALALAAVPAQADSPAKASRTPTLQSDTERKAAGENHFNPATGTTEGYETGTLTGTAIRKTYKVNGHHTDAAQPVYIIDRRDPRFTSRSTVGGILHGLPFTYGH